MRQPTTGLRGRTKWLAPKVPEITLIFWVIKLLTTGIGETVSDAIGQRSVPVAGAVGVLGFTLALAALALPFHTAARLVRAGAGDAEPTGTMPSARLDP